LFLIIVNVLGYLKGVGGLTSYFLRGGGMDVFWNDPFCLLCAVCKSVSIGCQSIRFATLAYGHNHDPRNTRPRILGLNELLFKHL
jgi:hypothetical protein